MDLPLEAPVTMIVFADILVGSGPVDGWIEAMRDSVMMLRTGQSIIKPVGRAIRDEPRHRVLDGSLAVGKSNLWMYYSIEEYYTNLISE